MPLGTTYFCRPEFSCSKLCCIWCSASRALLFEYSPAGELYGVKAPLGFPLRGVEGNCGGEKAAPGELAQFCCCWGC